MSSETQEGHVVVFDRVQLSALTEVALSLKAGLQEELAERFPRLLTLEEKEGLTITETVQHAFWTMKMLLEKCGPFEEDDDEYTPIQRTAIFFNNLLPENGDDQSYNPKNEMLRQVCHELILNCYYQGAEFIYIDIDVEEGYIIVFDDVERSTEEIQYLLDELNQPCLDLLALSKRCGRNVGTGISTIRNMFEDMDSNERLFQGCLRYVTDGKRIIAIVSWDPDVYFGD